MLKMFIKNKEFYNSTMLIFFNFVEMLVYQQIFFDSLPKKK